MIYLLKYDCGTCQKIKLCSPNKYFDIEFIKINSFARSVWLSS